MLSDRGPEYCWAPAIGWNTLYSSTPARLPCNLWNISLALHHSVRVTMQLACCGLHHTGSYRVTMPIAHVVYRLELWLLFIVCWGFYPLWFTNIFSQNPRLGVALFSPCHKKNKNNNLALSIDDFCLGEVPTIFVILKIVKFWLF